MSKNILYIIAQDSVSDKAIKILEASNIQFQRIVVGLNGFGKFMWRDTRTFEVPSLLTDTKIYAGLDEIAKFATFRRIHQ
jgi:hypothetical protein